MARGEETSLSRSVNDVLTRLAPVLPRSARKLSHDLHATSQVEEPDCQQQQHHHSTAPPPVIIGLTGLQGSGKSTWAGLIVDALRQQHGLNAISISLDDFYWPHKHLVKLRQASPDNQLLRTRGQPGTHDEELVREFFTTVNKNRTGDIVAVPSFDKSCFNGEGDRAPRAGWKRITLPVDVVVFEGWCIGFSPLEKAELMEKHRQSVARRLAPGPSANDRNDPRISTDTLADHAFDHLLMLNQALENYYETFMGPQHFDCLVHLDTDNLQNVYSWRLDQERALLARTGHGMDESSVYDFVRGYMPAYELYLDALRDGFFDETSGKGTPQLRIVLDRARKIVKCSDIRCPLRREALYRHR